MYVFIYLVKKVHVGNDQEKVQTEEILTPKTEAEKTNKNKLTIRYLYLESQVSSHFPMGGHLVT